MYPFAEGNVYVRNAWYVAAFAEELDDGPIERIIMDEPIALFRMADGKPAAMWGLCPHRFYPLANGIVIGDAIQCNYHGFRFDGRTGACVKIPSQSASPKGFRQRIYPIVEHGAWLWIWPGDPAQADPDLLPSLDEIGFGPGWRNENVGLQPTAGRAQLLIENLMDLTHVAFLHGALVDGDSFLESPIQVAEDGTAMRATRLARTPWVNGFYDVVFGPDNRFAGLHESQTESWYHSPGYIRTDIGTIRTIEGVATIDRAVFGLLNFHHIVTPETRHSTHYFSAFSRNYRLDDDDFSTTMKQLDRDVRAQDVVAVGQIEERLQKYPPQSTELLARADKAAVMVRRKIQAQLLDEAETAAISQQRDPAAM